MRETFWLVLLTGLLLLATGCSVFPKIGGDRMEPPDLREERRAIQIYGTINRQVTWAAREKVRSARDILSQANGATASPAEKPEPTVTRAVTREAIEPRRVEQADHELSHADGLLTAQLEVIGDPVVKPSLSGPSIREMQEAIRRAGREAAEASRIKDKKIQAALRGDDEGGFASSIWKTLKIVLLVILIVLGVAGYLFIRVQYGKTFATVFGLAWLAILSGLVVWFYYTYIIIGGLVLAGAGLLGLLAWGLHEAWFGQKLIQRVQDGRRQLPPTERDKWDQGTSANMTRAEEKKIRRLKDISEVSSTKESDREQPNG